MYAQTYGARGGKIVLHDLSHLWIANSAPLVGTDDHISKLSAKKRHVREPSSKRDT